MIVNRREVYTRAHDACLFTTIRPANEKYKRNIYYKGAIIWNELPVDTRNINKCENFKLKQKKWLLQTVMNHGNKRFTGY